MELLSITKFLHLTKLSGTDLLSMLERGEVRGSFAENGELKLDIRNLTPEDLARRSATQTEDLDPETQALVEETVASEIAAQLDSILDEAFELALEWESNRNS